MRYFDLGYDHESFKLQSSEPPPAQVARWWPQYLALVAGIIAQRFLSAYLQTGRWQLQGFWAFTVAAIIIGILGFPAVYRHSVDPEKHGVVQLCVIFSAGMGWQSLVKLAEIV